MSPILVRVRLRLLVSFSLLPLPTERGQITTVNNTTVTPISAVRHDYIFVQE